MLGLSGAFRRGVGVARDPGYHGTPAYMVTPPRARAELAAAGFELRDVCSKSGVRATRRSVLWTSWYYYRAVRPTE